MSTSLIASRSLASNLGSGCSPGVSTRRYRRTPEPVGRGGRHRGAVEVEVGGEQTFVERTRESLSALITRQFVDLRPAVMMIDGIELNKRMMIVALRITTESVKIPLALSPGSSENTTVVTALLSDLVERGLDPEQSMLFVIDWFKAL